MAGDQGRRKSGKQASGPINYLNEVSLAYLSAKWKDLVIIEFGALLYEAFKIIMTTSTAPIPVSELPSMCLRILAELILPILPRQHIFILPIDLPNWTESKVRLGQISRRGIVD